MATFDVECVRGNREMKRRICIISEDYPSEGMPHYPFVQELAHGLLNEDCECFVIAPQSVSRAIYRREKLRERVSVDGNSTDERIPVFRPYTLTFSNTTKKLLNDLSCYLYRKAIERTIRKIKGIDYVYCYFWHIGLITAKALGSIHAKLYVQASECEISINDSYFNAGTLNRIDGVVCASRKNYEESLNFGLITPESNTVIVPNGFREDEFYRIDQSTARDRLGFDQNAFIVSYVGDFNDRKGAMRLSKALEDHPDVYSIFIGKGEKKPTCGNILFQGTVEHDQVCTYLNSADVFVLPTNAEGCCNAIIEAIACGLPVISSNKPFNDEILDDSYSIRINENSVTEISEAIRELKNNPLKLQEMSEKALKASGNFKISKRAHAIASFISKKDT